MLVSDITVHEADAQPSGTGVSEEALDRVAELLALPVAELLALPMTELLGVPVTVLLEEKSTRKLLPVAPVKLVIVAEAKGRLSSPPEPNKVQLSRLTRE